MSGILELRVDEISAVGGGVDHGVVSTGLGIMAASLEVGMVCPPAGGMMATIGLAIAVSGLFS